MATSPTTADPNVVAAFRLGWLLESLYLAREDLVVAPPAGPPSRLPAELPGESTLNGNLRAQLVLAEAEEAREVLVNGASLPSDASPLADTGAVLAALADPQSDAEHRLAAIFQLHQQLLSQLSAASFVLGRAYGLGRALAETALLPSDAVSLRNQFNPERGIVLSGWLDDLAESFPTYASFAVKASLHAWTRWAEDPVMDGQGRLGHRAGARHQTLENAASSALLYLHRQGHLWFSLLAAEASPGQFLIAENYVDAAGRMIRRSGRLAWSFVRGWIVGLLLLVAAIAATVWGVTHYLHGASEAAAIVAAVVGGAGVSWRAVGATLGATAKRLEEPLWEAEVASAIALATIRLPRALQTATGAARTNADSPIDETRPSAHRVRGRTRAPASRSEPELTHGDVR
jgi:hypothetical protein